MSEFLPYKAKESIFSLSKCISPRIAKLEIIIIEFTEEMIGICHCGIFGLVNCINYFKDLFSKKFIISTHNQNDIFRATVV